MKVSQTHWDFSGESKQLRKDIGEIVRSSLSAKNRVEFRKILSQKLGVKTTTVDTYLTTLIKGRRDGSTKKESSNYTFSQRELQKLGILFETLGINNQGSVVRRILSDYPSFKDYYNGAGPDNTFLGLLGRFDEIVSKQVSDYRKELISNYTGLSNDEDRRRIVRDLEGDLNYLEDEGIFETLLNKE